MRIGIDVRYLSHGLMGGVHTYVAHFLPPLLELTAGQHEVFLYADNKRAFELQHLPEHVTLRRLPWRSPLSSARHDLLMWRDMAHDQLDVVHFPANYGFGPPGTPTVVTVHDALTLLPVKQVVGGTGSVRTPRMIAMVLYSHYMSVAALRRADLVLTVSQHAAHEIAHHGHYDRARIVPVPHAPTADLRRIEDDAVLTSLRERHQLHRPFVLADALKNPAALIQAWRRLPGALREGRQIVFFCRHASPLPIVFEAVARGEARLLIRPSREDLIALYSIADAFVFPSWIEGFGIPILEAMRCGSPVVASNRGSIPEVAGNAALLAEAEDPAALAVQLERVLADPQLAQQLRLLGFNRVAQFSWHSTAARTLDTYVRAAAAA